MTFHKSTVDDLRMDRSICYATLRNLNETTRNDILMYLESLENELLGANSKEFSETLREYFRQLESYLANTLEDPEET